MAAVLTGGRGLAWAFINGLHDAVAANAEVKESAKAGTHAVVEIGINELPKKRQYGGYQLFHNLPFPIWAALK